MNKKTLLFLLIEALVFIGILFGMKSCDNTKLDLSEQNYKAAKDSIETLCLSNGDLLYEKSLYILKEKDLLNELEITKEELKELKKKVGDPVVITKIESQIKYDTIYTTKDSIIYAPDSTIQQIKFQYNDEWLALEGETNIDNNQSKTQINNINVPVPLKVGITEDYNFFATSSNPYLTITDIEGVIVQDKSLNQQKKRWSHGISLSVGPQYNIINRNIDIGIQLGYGIHFNF